MFPPTLAGLLRGCILAWAELAGGMAASREYHCAESQRLSSSSVLLLRCCFISTSDLLIHHGIFVFLFITHICYPQTNPDLNSLSQSEYEPDLPLGYCVIIISRVL